VIAWLTSVLQIEWKKRITFEQLPYSGFLLRGTNICEHYLDSQKFRWLLKFSFIIFYAKYKNFQIADISSAWQWFSQHRKYLDLATKSAIRYLWPPKWRNKRGNPEIIGETWNHLIWRGAPAKPLSYIFNIVKCSLCNNHEIIIFPLCIWYLQAYTQSWSLQVSYLWQLERGGRKFHISSMPFIRRILPK